MVALRGGAAGFAWAAPPASRPNSLVPATARPNSLVPATAPATAVIDVTKRGSRIRLSLPLREVIRPQDLLNLRFEFVNLELQIPFKPELPAGDRARLV